MDDPQRAILGGLGILDAIQPFRARLMQDYGLDFNVRIGINTGTVVVGDFGSRDRSEYTAMGDAINLAARLEQSAQPGTIQVGGATYHLTAPFFEFKALGEIEIRGKSHREPVHQVTRAVGISGSPWDVAGTAPALVGRDHELVGDYEQALGSLDRMAGDHPNAERHVESATAIVRELAAGITDPALRAGFVRDATKSLESMRT